MLLVSLIRFKNEALKKCTSESSLSASKEVKIDKWPDSPYLFFPIDYCVRINSEPDRLFSHRLLESDCINFKTFAFLAVYWILTLLNIIILYTNIKVQQQKINRSSTMLNNVFKARRTIPLQCDTLRLYRPTFIAHLHKIRHGES